MAEYEKFKSELGKISLLKKKPKLLLHSCCGPCSTHVINLLHNYFDITIYYYNPNIYPNSEFDRRLNTQIELLSKLDYQVNLIVEKAPYEVFLENIKEYSHLPEKSMRCYNCYLFRMKKLQEQAIKNNFDYFTTTLSVSPHKNSKWINEIGNLLDTNKCKYLYSDFKKENGYLESTMLAREYDLYRQDYCGCEYSLEESIKRKSRKE